MLTALQNQILFAREDTTIYPQGGSMVAHWDAGSIVANDSTKIASWRDGVSGILATGEDSTKQPVYKVNRLGGRPSLTFNGARLKAENANYLQSALNSQNYSISVVYKNLGVASLGILVAATNGSGGLWYSDGTGIGAYPLTAFPFAGQTGFTVVTYTYRSNQGTGNSLLGCMYVNGSLIYASMWSNPQYSTPVAPGVFFGIGNATGASSFPGNNEIFDVFVWGAELSPFDVLQMQKIVCDKYSQTYPWASIPAFYVFDGDSITVGLGGGSAAQNYPLQVATTLGLVPGQWSNVAIAGSTLTNMVNNAPKRVDQIPTITGKYVVLCAWEWFNSRGGAPTPFNTAQSYLAARKAIPKIRMVWGTSTDSSTDNGVETNRNAYNTAFDGASTTNIDSYVALHNDTHLGTSTAYANNNATATGTGAGTNLTLSAVTGVVAIGATVFGTGAPANTTIVSQTSGPAGGAGVYVTNNATTSSGASLTISNWQDGTHLTAPAYQNYLAPLFVTGINALPVVYEIVSADAKGNLSAAPSSGPNNTASAVFTVNLSAVATAAQSIILTASQGTITATCAGATITNNGTGAVTVAMAAGTFTWTFTYTPTTTGAKTITPTNGQSWANPATLNYTSV